MDTSIAVALSAQRTLLRQLDVVANNIANANSVGFRSESVDFESIISNATPDKTFFVEVADVQFSHSEGAKLQTGNSLDIAITGEGYLALQTPAGTVYTRDGRMMVNPFGELQSLEGYPVLDASGAPILVPSRGKDIIIHGDGRIIDAGKTIGNIGVFDLPPELVSARFGNSAFTASREPQPVALGTNTSIVQGYVEASNTDPMRELANLITVQRSFEAVSDLIEKADGAVRKSVDELSQRG